MPALKTQNPSYRLHRKSGQAVVTLSGKDFYLGPHDTEASRREYDRLIAEWLQHGRQLPRDGTGADITIAELVNAFRKHTETYYVKNGRQTGEHNTIRLALQYVLKFYADTPAREFGPLALKTVRDTMARDGVVRTSINRQINRIKLAFKWSVQNELIPPSVYQGLQAVSGLRKGRTPGVMESDPVRPVPDVYVDAIKPYVSRQVWAMIELQRLTGMRSGEVINMTTGAINTTGAVWEYRPTSHKMEHHDRERIVPLGPKAQDLLRPFLKPDLAAPIFSPKDAEAERHAAAKVHRRPNQKPNRRKTKRTLREAYDKGSYRHAIARGCRLAETMARKACPNAQAGELFIPSWHPHQLRHNYATAVRKRFGLEVARAALGHSSAAVTELYAEIDHTKAAAVAAEVG